MEVVSGEELINLGVLYWEGLTGENENTGPRSVLLLCVNCILTS